MEANLPFTGQVDFVCKASDDKIYLVDIKTSVSKQRTYPLQMAAYQILLAHHGIQIEAALLVYLKKDGDFPDIDRYDDLSREKDVFLAALECWHYFNKKKGDGIVNRKRKRTKIECAPTN